MELLIQHKNNFRKQLHTNFVIFFGGLLTTAHAGQDEGDVSEGGPSGHFSEVLVRQTIRFQKVRKEK